jgi:hypothetical protein
MKVGGAMFDSRSPGTPTIEPGYSPENTSPIKPNNPAHSNARSHRRGARFVGRKNRLVRQSPHHDHIDPTDPFQPVPEAQYVDEHHDPAQPDQRYYVESPVQP